MEVDLAKGNNRGKGGVDRGEEVEEEEDDDYEESENY